MQKNIVFEVNSALSQDDDKNKKRATSAIPSEEFVTLREDIACLKQENSLFAAAVDEMRLQNEELKNKINELISNSSSKKKKKKTNRNAG